MLKPFWIWLWIREGNRQSDLAAHGTLRSLTPLWKYDTTVTLDLIFEWLWLPLTGMFIEKTCIGKLSCTIPLTFKQKYRGVTRDRFLSQRCHWHHCDENRRFHMRFSPRIWSHIQKGVNPCIRGLGGVVWWKNKGRKSRVRVPLKNQPTLLYTQSTHCTSTVS
jgi:hypothetical protein